MAAPLLLTLSGSLAAQQPAAPEIVAPGETYADLAGLVDSADLVVHALVKKQAEVDAERAPGLAPGYARLSESPAHGEY